MPDLKKLLAPLEDSQMPDRWELIRRRHVAPLPERRRSRMPVFAAAAAVLALLVAVVGGLLPLAEGPRVPGANDQPPAWLVDAAYQAAYTSGDITPGSAEWALLPRSAIPTPVGTGGAGSSEQEYVVVLHGRFTAFWASPPSVASLPTGSVLAIAYDASTHDVTDSAVTDGDIGIEGLTPFELPAPSHVLTTPMGWHATVPPGWQTQTNTITVGGQQVQQAVIATAAPSALLYTQEPVPMVAELGFPKDGVALVVSEASPSVPTGFPANSPPVSLHASAEVSSGLDGSKVEMVLIQGPDRVYTAAVRIGREASPVDRAAIEDVVASIGWGASTTTASPTSSVSQSGALPSPDSVVDGRFVEPVELDGGVLRVDPPPVGTFVPALRPADADMLWADPAFAGKTGITVGYGLITLTRGEHGIEPMDAVPGWIAFASGNPHTYCPNMTTAPTPVDLPSSGFAAVSLISQVGNFTYAAASDVCGTVTQPAVAMATHVESIPWDQVGQVTSGRVDIRYTRQNCGRDDSYVVSADGDRYTLAVQVTVANDPLPCPAPMSVETSVLLTGDGGGTVGALEHAPLGTVRRVTGPTP